jgi:hypothetical protein
MTCKFPLLGLKKMAADGERFRLCRVRASGKSFLASLPWLPEKHDGSKAGGFRTAPFVRFELAFVAKWAPKTTSSADALVTMPL